MVKEANSGCEFVADQVDHVIVFECVQGLSELSLRHSLNISIGQLAVLSLAADEVKQVLVLHTMLVHLVSEVALNTDRIKL